MRFSFGQITVKVHGLDEQNRSVPEKWKPYLLPSDEQHADVFLRLADMPIVSRNSPGTGWEKETVDGKNVMMYSQKETRLFALQYQPPEKCATAFINREMKGALPLGLQFGALLALHQQCIGLHGVTLLCGNEIVILSAPSGTGKTTLGKMLEKYGDAVIINGDFALLHPTEAGVIFEPTPFCGSSRRCLNHRFRVNRVVFLGQAKENRWNEMDGRETVVRFMSNAFVPDWDKRMLQAVQGSVLKCISMLKVNAYDFAPTKEAAEFFLKTVEKDSSLHSG